MTRATAITLRDVQRQRRATGAAAPKRRRRSAERKVDLAAEFMAAWDADRTEGRPQGWGLASFHFAAEYRFALSDGRRWAFDLAYVRGEHGVWPKIAVEFEGGTYTAGRHTRGNGYERDCEKYNAAIERGWVVLRYTTQMLRRDPQACVAQVRAVIEARLRQCR